MSVGIPQLRAFLAVVDAGGFGAAAERLGVSQSAVSHAVAALERVTGRPVLTRQGQAVPTRFGEQILGHARAAVSAVSAISVLAADRARPRGRVTVAAPPTVCHGLLPELTRGWRVEFPGVEVSVFEGEDEEVAGWLDEGTAELAVLVDPPVSPAGSLLVGTDRFHALLRADHPLAGQASVELAELVDDDFLLSRGGCERQLGELHRRAGVPLRPSHRIRQLSTLFEMVRAGVGVSALPGLAAGMPGPDLVLVPLRASPERRLVLSGPTHRPWHPIARALTEATTPVPAGAGAGATDPGRR